MAERSKNSALAAARRELLTRLLEKSGTDRSAGRAPAEPARGEGALSFVQVLPPGVYVAMNGRHFRWDQCRKNRDTGVFESLSI